MKCPKCHELIGGNHKTVIDTRRSENGTAVRRRRECPHCGTRFTTYERVERFSWDGSTEDAEYVIGTA